VSKIDSNNTIFE